MDRSNEKPMTTPSQIPEFEQAKIIADRVLDKPYADPDSDESIVARQFLRLCEQTRAASVPSDKERAGETRTITHHVMELAELQDLIERGPTFCAIRSFTIEYCGPKESIKESMEA